MLDRRFYEGDARKAEDSPAATRTCSFMKFDSFIEFDSSSVCGQAVELS
jgi:hypothetical protein